MKTEEEYNSEVFQLMRDVYPTLKGEEKERAERLFPELKESEDERMKRVLAEGFAVLSKDEEWYDGVTVGQILTWLEKQREQKPSDYENANIQQMKGWSEEDENRFRNLVYLVEHSDEGKGTKEGFVKFINRLKSLEERFTWKPSEGHIKALEDAIDF